MNLLKSFNGVPHPPVLSVLTVIRSVYRRPATPTNPAIGDKQNDTTIYSLALAFLDEAGIVKSWNPPMILERRVPYILQPIKPLRHPSVLLQQLSILLLGYFDCIIGPVHESRSEMILQYGAVESAQISFRHHLADLQGPETPHLSLG